MERYVNFTGAFRQTQADISGAVGSEFERDGAERLWRGCRLGQMRGSWRRRLRRRRVRGCFRLAAGDFRSRSEGCTGRVRGGSRRQRRRFGSGAGIR
jgi:hypothetical protein